ncbi:hypothetical protein D3C71_1431720 [compost metagenome]
MQQQVGVHRLFQGGAECGDQAVRQIADEADRIGHHHRPRPFDPDTAGGRVQGREELIGGVGVGAGQGVEQGGLAGVGVAHQRHRQRTAPGACPALGHTLALHPVQPFAQRLDLGADHAAIHFKLGLAGPAHPDTAALTFQVAPHAREARGQMLQLRQLHLQLALMALCAQRKDIQDECDTVDHPQIEGALEVALLGGRQGLIEQDDIGQQRLRHRDALVGLAGTDEEFGVGAIAPSGQGADDFRARALGQHGEFLGMGGEVWITQIHADNQSAHTCTILEPKRKCPPT